MKNSDIPMNYLIPEYITLNINTIGIQRLLTYSDEKQEKLKRTFGSRFTLDGRV